MEALNKYHASDTDKPDALNNFSAFHAPGPGLGSDDAYWLDTASLPVFSHSLYFDMQRKIRQLTILAQSDLSRVGVSLDEPGGPVSFTRFGGIGALLWFRFRHIGGLHGRGTGWEKVGIPGHRRLGILRRFVHRPDSKSVRTARASDDLAHQGRGCIEFFAAFGTTDL